MGQSPSIIPNDRLDRDFYIVLEDFRGSGISDFVAELALKRGKPGQRHVEG